MTEETAATEPTAYQKIEKAVVLKLLRDEIKSQRKRNGSTGALRVAELYIMQGEQE